MHELSMKKRTEISNKKIKEAKERAERKYFPQVYTYTKVNFVKK